MEPVLRAIVTERTTNCRRYTRPMLDPVVMASGSPTGRTTRIGVGTRRLPGVAAKSRVIRMTGSSWSASMTVSVILFIFVSSHLCQNGVEAAVTLLNAVPVALDPGVHQVQGLDLQAHRPRLRPTRPAASPASSSTRKCL